MYLLICCCCVLLIFFFLWWVFCCSDVCYCLVGVIFYWFVVVTAKTRETRPTHSPKPINRTTRSNYLNGWSKGWSFTNPTQSGRIEKFVQTRTTGPMPTPNCKYLILFFEEASLHHGHRESTFCTDLLAKAGNTMLDAFSFYVSSPHFVVSQFMADIWGVSYTRVL